MSSVIYQQSAQTKGPQAIILIDCSEKFAEVDVDTDVSNFMWILKLVETTTYAFVTIADKDQHARPCVIIIVCTVRTIVCEYLAKNPYNWF